MKQLLYILIFTPIFCFGQNSGTVYQTGATNQASAYKGGITADSINAVPVMDTTRAGLYLTEGTATARKKGRIVVNTSDSNLYFYNGGRWVIANANVNTKVSYSDSGTVYYSKYGVDTAKANIRAAKVSYSDSTGFLPTKTYLSQNYFAQGGNTFGATGVLGTNGANHLDFETNNTTRVRVFSNGNVAIGTTTDNGYKAQVNGTFNAADNLSYTKSSVTTTFSISEAQNHRYTQINAPGAAGGWQGGVTIATATNGGATANRYWFSRLGALGIGSDMGAAVEASNPNSLLIKSSLASPSGTFGGDQLRLYTDDYEKYTHSNGKIFSALIIGGANGGTIPGTDIVSNVTVGLGSQLHPLVNGWASDLIVFGRNEGNTISEIARFCARDSSLGLRTTQPTSRLDINGTFGYKQLRLRTTYTPTGSADTNGNIGDIAWDGTYFYWKTAAGWLRVQGQTF